MSKRVYCSDCRYVVNEDFAPDLRRCRVSRVKRPENYVDRSAVINLMHCFKVNKDGLCKKFSAKEVADND
jgi:hypothetical protein